MSRTSEPPALPDGQSAEEFLKDRFDDRRHVLKRIVDLGGPLSDDARKILEIIGEDVSPSSTTASGTTHGGSPFCPSCGGDAAGDAFCRHCGTELPAEIGEG